MQIVVDRTAIITLVNSPGGTEALCRGCKSPDGSVMSHFSLARFRGVAAKPSQRIGYRELMWGSHPGASAPGRELPALRA
ncbi:hypothetical protein LF1_33910 [Rubripirellula obstinata]|uniref:Uncharacterized protein n=1 Tax=Rubripirellula obstinata TaxID=406547 RepID=A0A5B1CM33_9BACT|nr:hypothetical protein LF1_33910 [Rubripirellula obstinata]